MTPHTVLRSWSSTSTASSSQNPPPRSERSSRHAQLGLYRYGPGNLRQLTAHLADMLSTLEYLGLCSYKVEGVSSPTKSGEAVADLLACLQRLYTLEMSYRFIHTKPSAKFPGIECINAIGGLGYLEMRGHGVLA